MYSSKHNPEKEAENPINKASNTHSEIRPWVDQRSQTLQHKKLLQLIADGSKLTKTAQLLKTDTHNTGCSCPACGRMNTVQQKVIQAKKLNDGKMQDLAAELGGDSRSTVAVAKIGAKYGVYSQGSLSSKQGIIDEYTNVSLKSDTPMGTGYHAESIAMMSGESISKIAASQGICKRCEAMLADNGVEAVNIGGQFTEHWQAPFNEEIDENKSFPAKAKDTDKDGQSGTRWGMTSSSLYPIAKSKWGSKHTGGW